MNFRILFFLSLLSVSVNAQIHDIDSNEYNFILIGSQTWMVENLNVSRFANGDTIFEAKTEDEWVRAGINQQPAWCYYKFNKHQGEKYGKLYNWYAVVDSREISPQGWKIPDLNDLEMLITFLGGEEKAGIKLKATNGWLKDGNGTNESGFNMESGTSCSGNGKFTKPHKFSELWTSSEFSIENAFYVGTEFKNNNITIMDFSKSWGYSIRCIKQ